MLDMDKKKTTTKKRRQNLTSKKIILKTVLIMFGSYFRDLLSMNRLKECELKQSKGACHRSTLLKVTLRSACSTTSSTSSTRLPNQDTEEKVKL